MPELDISQDSAALRLGLALAFGLALLLGLFLAMDAARTPEMALAQGPTIRYVAPAPTGNDSGNDCTNSGSPCRTVQYAVDQASAGYDILSKSGARNAALKADSCVWGGTCISKTVDGAGNTGGFTSGTLNASETLTSRVYLPYIIVCKGTLGDMPVYPEPIGKYGPKVAHHGHQVYVAWSGPPYYNYGNRTVFVAASTDDGWTWRQPVTTTGTGPAIATDVNGDLHIVYLGHSSAFDSIIYYTRSIDSGQTFNPPIALDVCSANYCSEPDIALNASGNPYVVWQEQTNVILARVTIHEDNSVNITTTIVGATTTCSSEPPKVAVSPSGQNVYVVWKCPPYCGAYVRAYFARSTDEGDTFEPRFNPTGFIRHGEYSPGVAAFGEDIVYITWVLDQYGDHRANFARSENSGKSFSPRRELGQSGSDHDSTIAADTLGQVCVAWRQGDSVEEWDLYFRCSLNRGQNFLPASLLAAGPPGTGQHHPALVLWNSISCGTYLDAVWQDERNDYADIFFSSVPVTP
jgi:hypothetical protein